jgi:hypothetical protein
MKRKELLQNLGLQSDRVLTQILSQLSGIDPNAEEIPNDIAQGLIDARKSHQEQSQQPQQSQHQKSHQIGQATADPFEELQQVAAQNKVLSDQLYERSLQAAVQEGVNFGTRLGQIQAVAAQITATEVWARTMGEFSNQSKSRTDKFFSTKLSQLMPIQTQSTEHLLQGQENLATKSLPQSTLF